MKRIIPTMNINHIEIELISFNKETLFSMFEIKIKNMSETTLLLDGHVIESLYREAKHLINDRLYPEDKK